MIIKNGEYIAIDSVETDDTLSGTGRPGEPLGLANPWKSTIETWSKIEPEKVDAWTKIPLPPSGDETKDKIYGWKNGAWTELDASSKVNIVDGKHTKVVAAGDDKIQIDVDISPDLIVEKGCLDFTK